MCVRCVLMHTRFKLNSTPRFGGKKSVIEIDPSGIVHCIVRWILELVVICGNRCRMSKMIPRQQERERDADIDGILDGMRRVTPFAQSSLQD